MLNLAGSSHRLRVQASVATTLHVQASWGDLVSGAVTLGPTNTVISDTSLTDVVAGPSSGARNVKGLMIRNAGSAATFVTVSHTDGTTAVELHRQILAPGGQIHYSEATGFQLSTPLPRAGVHGACATGSGAQILPALNATALTVTGAQAANRLDAIPFIPALDLSIDNLALEVTTLFASNSFKLAIYTDTGSMHPGSLIVGTGNLATDTTGYREETISATQLQAGTLYWLAAHYSSATQAQRAVALAAAYPFSAPAVTGTAMFTLYRVTSTYASGLPATFPTATPTSSVIPAIRLRTA